MEEHIGYLRVYPKVLYINKLNIAKIKKICAPLKAITSTVDIENSLDGVGPIFEQKTEGGQPLLVPFVKLWLPFRGELENCGVVIDDVHLHFNYYRQCSLGFSVDELDILAKNVLDLMLDCWSQ